MDLQGGACLFVLAAPTLMPHPTPMRRNARDLERSKACIRRTGVSGLRSLLFANSSTCELPPEWQGGPSLTAVDDDTARVGALQEDAAVLAGAFARARALIASANHTEGAYAIASCIDDLADKGSFAAIDFGLSAIDAAHESHLLLVSVLVATSVRPLRAKLPSRVELVARARKACSDRADIDALFMGL